MMTLLPAATDTPAASVIVMLEALLPMFVPMFLTNAMPARASDAARPNRRASASVAAARGARSLRESPVIAPEGKGRPPPAVSADAVAGLRARFPAPLSRSPDARRRGRAPWPGPTRLAWGRSEGGAMGSACWEEKNRLADLLGCGRLALVVLRGKRRRDEREIRSCNTCNFSISRLETFMRRVIRVTVSPLRMANARRSVVRATIPPHAPRHRGEMAPLLFRSAARPCAKGRPSRSGLFWGATGSAAIHES